MQWLQWLVMQTRLEYPARQQGHGSLSLERAGGFQGARAKDSTPTCDTRLHRAVHPLFHRGFVGRSGSLFGKGTPVTEKKLRGARFELTTLGL